MPSEPPSPAVVRSIAVMTGDVVAALELNCTTDDEATLRITPPFSARMRARLHVDGTGSDSSGRPEAGHGDGTGPRDSAAGADEPEHQTASTPGEQADREADRAGADAGREPLYIEPERLVADPPPYPRPANTRAELLADPETTYTVERHHEHHADAVDRWRESVPECIRDRVTLETPAGSTEVTVRTLERDLV